MSSMEQFNFGKNWLAFSKKKISKDRFISARYDFIELLSGINLENKTFLDIGFGQGLSLLIAAEQGARVTGCDINPRCAESLEITAKTLSMKVPSSVVMGSILDEVTISQLLHHKPEKFDIVHSWGVLHHTGNMTKAIKTACDLTTSGGYLILAIYNKHWSSPLWRIIKKGYCYSPRILRIILTVKLFPVIAIAKFLVTGKNPFNQKRGMDFFFDVVDWIGGYPYEYASINEVLSIVERHNFTCTKIVQADVPTGCNQFVFKKGSNSIE